MKVKFNNKNGDISVYAFLCGYIMRIETAKRWKEIYMEHNHFHVRTGAITLESRCFDMWEVFESNELTRAKKLYKSIKVQ